MDIPVRSLNIYGILIVVLDLHGLLRTASWGGTSCVCPFFRYDDPAIVSNYHTTCERSRAIEVKEEVT